MEGAWRDGRRVYVGGTAASGCGCPSVGASLAIFFFTLPRVSSCRRAPPRCRRQQRAAAASPPAHPPPVAAARRRPRGGARRHGGGGGVLCARAPRRGVRRRRLPPSPRRRGRRRQRRGRRRPPLPHRRWRWGTGARAVAAPAAPAARRGACARAAPTRIPPARTRGAPATGGGEGGAATTHRRGRVGKRVAPTVGGAVATASAATAAVAPINQRPAPRATTAGTCRRALQSQHANTQKIVGY